MPSPFPGMNPYIEHRNVWHGFHQRAITYMGEQLVSLVGDSYIVDVETQLYLHELSAEERRLVGEADITLAGGNREMGVPAVATMQAPIELAFPAVETERYSWLQIRDKTNRRIVTAIELLSPTNKKQGPDRDDYLIKRNHYINSAIHFVEIDLLRKGTRPHPPRIPPCDYYVLLFRAHHFDRAGCWPIMLRDRLPIIPIPLSSPDPDVGLDLQEWLNRVYDATRYGNWIYSDPPEPPLSSEDAEWAKQFVPQR